MDISEIFSCFIDSNYDFIINKNMRKEDFKIRSYAKSAIKEIQSYLEEFPDSDPIEVIEDFIYLLDDKMCGTNNEDTYFMYCIYHDICDDIRNLLIYWLYEWGGDIK